MAPVSPAWVQTARPLPGEKEVGPLSELSHGGQPCVLPGQAHESL